MASYEQDERLPKHSTLKARFDAMVYLTNVLYQGSDSPQTSAKADCRRANVGIKTKDITVESRASNRMGSALGEGGR